MRISRRNRWLTVLVAVAALLFGQLALASYACPGIAKAAEVEQMFRAAMPCAEEMSRAMDDEQHPGLCHAHCQAAQQSADSYQVPPLATLEQLGPVLTVAAATASGESPAPPARSTPPPPAGPPLAIRHCCLRI
ncbi:hypothetical protein [Ramlibacter sp.]|uniref:hypothetical protein n=1 Tax=Ramlibacter sp. TaxID=1917967 RepID=UPI001855B55F|nr:hypothetical protein [Ramlibacter sp.]MBA2676142.1 hypothetical protein [Ramlibacter sp.]